MKIGRQVYSLSEIRLHEKDRYSSASSAESSQFTSHDHCEKHRITNLKNICRNDLASALRFPNLFSLIALAVAVGCGSSSFTKAGSISITDSNGSGTTQLTSLGVTKSARLSMSATGDKTGAGIDWTVTCGGSPLNGSTSGGACGTLAPIHTSDAGATIYTAPSLVPYLTNVTITASVTSDPAASSTTTLPIVALPISVVLIASASTDQTGQIVPFQASALNDTSNAGVSWSVTCGSSDCGSFSPVVTPPSTQTAYTAPATVPIGGTVTVTATSLADTTKFISLPVTVTAPSAAPISVTVSPATTYVSTSGATRTAHFVATVANDSNLSGVKWTATCGNASCGSITAQTASDVAATFLGPTTVPTGSKVSLTATSVSDPTKFATATATITTAAPITVAITSPLSAALPVGTNSTLIATTANDSASSGINWTATCGSAGACGTFNLSPAHTSSGGTIIYTAPTAIPTGDVVTITAMSASSNPANAATTTTTIVPSTATIAFVQSPPTTVTAKTSVPVSATVKNDITPGGVSWNVQCAATDPGACGYITPYQTADGANASYVAPPVPPTGPVTLVASSIAFSDLTVSSKPLTIAPSTAISIGFVPFAPAQLTTASTVNLTAAVTNDTTDAGVDWQICASGCGFFTTQPAIPAIAATATTPFIPAVPAVTSTSVQGWPNGLAIPYTAPSTVPDSRLVGIAATAHGNTNVATASNITITNASNNALGGPALNGVVRSGNSLVAGGTVSLYAAGTSGYGSASTLLASPGGSSSAITDSNGAFTLAAGYTCPQNGQVYLVATGGKVGSNAANPNLAMMSALGPCSNLSSAPLVVNEVTTVASVWALAPFSTNQPLTGLSGYLYTGSSPANLAGLAKAFATVNNLVDVTTGQPLYNVPAGNAVVPYVEINTLADMLNACTASSGGQYGDGTPCGNLFVATAPLYSQPQFGSTPPADTIQAAFNAAQHPSGSFQYGISVSGLYSLITPASPFLPFLPTAPQDLSIALHYTGGGLDASSNASDFAFDANNNLWITATSSNKVVEWNSVGATVSPSDGFTAGGINSPGPIAIDSSNNVWVSNADSLSELSSNGIPALQTPFYGVSNGLNLAIDGLDNVWITNPSGVTKYNSVGTELSPVGGYQNTDVAGIDQIVIDQSNNVWVGDKVGGAFYLAELGDSNGQLVVNAQVFGSDLQTPMVADGSGNIWSTPGSELCQLPPYGGTATQEYFANCTQGASFGGSGLNSIYNSNGIALDGAGRLWIGNAGDATMGFASNLTEIIPSQVSVGNYAGFYSPTLAVGTKQVAVDGSGNAWVLLADSTVTEYIGIATPTVTPIALALKTKKLGKTP